MTLNTEASKPLFGRHLNQVWSWMVAIAIIMASIRGILIIHMDAPLDTVKTIVAGLSMVLVFFGWLYKANYKHNSLVWLKNLLKFNLMLGVVNIFIDLLISAQINVAASIYLHVAPYAIFIFFRLSKFYFDIILTIILLAIGLSVMGNFIESLQGPEGYQNVLDYNTKLVPSEDATFGRSTTGGVYLRASGYTGNPHDSANILGMLFSFLVVRFISHKRMTDLGLFLFAGLAMTMTQSASNIIVAFGISFLFVVYLLFKMRDFRTILFISLGLAFASIFALSFSDVISIFLLRLGEDGGRNGMIQHLNLAALINSLPFLLIGHAGASGADFISVEVAHLKLIFQLGIIHSLIIFSIMLYPIVLAIKLKKTCTEALPYLAAIAFGFFSLLHYGSVFRGTSIFLFYLIYSFGLRQLLRYEITLKENQILDRRVPRYVPFKA